MTDSRTVQDGFDCFDCENGEHDECTGEAYVEWDSGGSSEVECKCHDRRHQSKSKGDD